MFYIRILADVLDYPSFMQAKVHKRANSLGHYDVLQENDLKEIEE